MLDDAVAVVLPACMRKRLQDLEVGDGIQLSGEQVGEDGERSRLGFDGVVMGKEETGLHVEGFMRCVRARTAASVGSSRLYRDNYDDIFGRKGKPASPRKSPGMTRTREGQVVN